VANEWFDHTLYSRLNDKRSVPASDGSDDFIGLRRALTNAMRG
jgi:hypothetical protein